MRDVEIGLGLQSNLSFAEYARLATAAEAHGIDVLSVFADLLFQPPLPALLEMARVTDRVRLGAACWNPYSMHPYEIAGQLAALDAASDGRAYLGLARGTWLGDIGLTQPRPLAHLREAVEFIYRLLAGDGAGFRGEVFELTPGVALRYETQRADPPLLIGAWGPRAVAMAGSLAHEIKIGGTANPAMLPVMRARLRPGERAAGREPGEVRIVVGAVTVVDLDGAAARRRARREVAMYLGVVGDLDPTVDVPHELLAEIKARVAAGDHDGAGSLIPDELLDLFAFSGTPDQVAAQAQRLIDAGAARVEFGTPQGLDTQRGIELIGNRVLPALDRSAGRG
ncbi:LLM class flavin-dependent oxidoreductase [Prauserella sp. PE36]|uniref:LLM class flavin-dependent oxidoreductase n=1 Tax=Prauserella endophytica TaxID=1592324 RepID=A0ABY2SBX1_9PSEU|nr:MULTISPECIES: LLM class flavin-dependent oxidoreductase [Prauserella]PXY23112.1 5,10-methylene tetrahydromethanopterin reductase [Prauserella coralliicola]RBM17130.1 LLM class flavin-dependent oxidoreductase [Prauserella sp. PE36]TKG72495.1 LLM class flavin-dependent oxidoreductase [Prauserella endophytica]